MRLFVVDALRNTRGAPEGRSRTWKLSTSPLHMSSALIAVSLQLLDICLHLPPALASLAHRALSPLALPSEPEWEETGIIRMTEAEAGIAVEAFEGAGLGLWDEFATILRQLASPRRETEEVRHTTEVERTLLRLSLQMLVSRERKRDGTIISLVAPPPSPTLSLTMAVRLGDRIGEGKKVAESIAEPLLNDYGTASANPDPLCEHERVACIPISGMVTPFTRFHFTL
ncbi:hypothetical protein BLNAU_7547 [Blattamonas nauphoetae]|uniref:Uncharacterized protein n=1 Tax=Blattamonas nauphoetae TaxID=2049346 RepID=A0ABQ9Y0W8_9EUKA|nr:hypothetical protein BLNAU_7547 [Blattamonas nauphoetae]